LLNQGERVVLDLNPHWSTLVRPVAVLVVVLAAVVAVVVVAGSSLPQLGAAALAAVLVVAAAWTAVRVARRQTTEFVVTSDRLVYRAGIIAKRGREIPLERINDISFRQSVWERLIGTGDLSIESAGARSRETFSDIPRPSRVQNEIYAQMEAVAGRRSTGGREPTLGEQLEKLDDLRRRGIISQAEFDAKKREWLDRM
jgi:uncharacterized membrane protein YdbT with pleckstrin-like domain